MQNGTSAVTISGSAGKAQFSGGRYNGSLENYIGQLLQELAGSQIRLAIAAGAADDDQRHARGLHDRPRGAPRSGAVDVSVVAYQWDPQHGLSFHHDDARAGPAVGPFAPMVEFAAQDHAAAKRPRSARGSSMW